VAIVGCAPDGTVLTWNSGAKTILGYSAQDIVGKHASLAVPGDRQTAFAHFAGWVLQGNTISRCDDVCLAKDGRRIGVSLTACPIRNSRGDIAVISVIVRDS